MKLVDVLLSIAKSWASVFSYGKIYEDCIVSELLQVVQTNMALKQQLITNNSQSTNTLPFTNLSKLNDNFRYTYNVCKVISTQVDKNSIDVSQVNVDLVF